MTVGLGQRIVQLHVTLACNLRCTHCYSSSGPSMRTALEVAVARDALTDLAAMGYETLAVSGGEPLVVPWLPELLEHAKSVGLRTAVTTNGTLNDARRLERLQPWLDVMAISVDGPPEMHNTIRAADDAFIRTERGIRAAADAGIRFGIIHALTKSSWEHLPWLADFADEHGASLLQIHPLERSGRAADGMNEQVPDEDVLARSYLLVRAIQEVHPSMAVQLDVFDREGIAIDPALVYATEDEPSGDERAADLVGVLVIEPDGTVVPISYGMSHELAVCNVRERRIADAWTAYRHAGYAAFRTLCRDVWREATSVCAELPFFDWHELIVSRSQSLRVAKSQSRKGETAGALVRPL